MIAAGLQFDIAWEEKQKNYKTVENYAWKAKDNGADVLVLPEMFATGFSLNTQITCEDEIGPTQIFLKNIAKKNELTVIGGLVQKINERCFNNAVVISPDGEMISTYSKINLIKLLGEDKSYSPGEKPVVFKIADCQCSVFICYDLRFPEIFRSVANECHVIFVIASWPEERKTHWDILLRARAVENQCYVVGVNRTGTGGGLNFAGESVMYSPMGDKIADAGNSPGLLFADIDADKVNDIRSQFPFLKDKKI